jgi:hypothetical protein
MRLAGCEQDMTTAVLIPTFNSARFLAESILSIKEGTTPCDIWVLDGGSTDGTREIGRGLGATVALLPEMHPAARIDHFIAHFKSEVFDFVAIQHSDDVAMPYRLEEQIQAFQADPELGCVGGAMIPFWYEPMKAKVHSDGPIAPPLGHTDILCQLPFWWTMQAPTLMFSVAELRKHPTIGFYNEFKFCNDWLHSFELMRAGMKFANIKEPVVAYRRHLASDGPTNREVLERQQRICRAEILMKLGFRWETPVSGIFHEIHLEGGPVWQGPEENRKAAGDWLLSMMRQNEQLEALPEPEFTSLVHHLWHRLFHP